MKKILLFVLFMSASVVAQDTTLTIFTTTSGVEDTRIYSASATTNYGTATTLNMYHSISNYARLLIRFLNANDSIPTNADIVACTLRVYVSGFSTFPSGNSATVFAYKVCKDWVENQATYNIYSTGNNWTTAGCMSASGSYCDDCSTEDRKAGYGIGTISLNSTGWKNIPIEPCVIEDCLAENNNGVLLYPYVEYPASSTSITIGSSEGSSGEDPEWKIYWVEGATSSATNKQHSPDGNATHHSVDGQLSRHGG